MITNAAAGNNRNSHIPLRRSTSRTNGTTKIGDDETNKWKMKFEEAEMKRKALIAQNEKSEFYLKKKDILVLFFLVYLILKERNYSIEKK